jgi:hypothetical protein
MKQLFIEGMVGLSLAGLVALCVTGIIPEPLRTVLGTLVVAVGPIALISPWAYYAE